MSFFTSRRFFPLFVTQFLGAFNDNMLKNAMVMLITYKLASSESGSAQLLVTLAGAIFILPYFIFSATAGQVSDKISREKVTRIIKLVEIGIMVAATIGFYTESVWFLLTVLFAMGVHSTFFGPIKFALLPQHLHDNELLRGNAYVEAGSFLAILTGTILGGVLILRPDGVAEASAALLFVAVLGYISSRYIPHSPAPDPNLVIGRNIWKETWKIVAFSKQNKRVYLSIIAISWFWLVGATYLSQFPAYAKDILRAESDVVTAFLTVFSIGVGIGSLLCNRLLKGEIKSTYVPIALAGMAIFGTDLYFASSHDVVSTSDSLLSLSEFISTFNHKRILFDLLMISISAGLYVVPLYAIMQHESEDSHRARIIAANNVVNAIFMVGAALVTLALLASNFTIPEVFMTMAAGNALVGAYIWKLLPSVRKK